MAESFNFSLNIGDGDVHPNFLEIGICRKMGFNNLLRFSIVMKHQ